MKMLSVLLLSTLVYSTAALAENPLNGLPENLAKVQKGQIDGGFCSGAVNDPTQIFDMGEIGTLYVVDCNDAAYQSNYHVYLSSDRNQIFQQISILQYDGTNRTTGTTSDIEGVSVDVKKHTMSSFAKGRGLSDCGQSSRIQFSADHYGIVRIVTTQIRDKERCDGKYNAWPLVFSQKAK